MQCDEQPSQAKLFFDNQGKNAIQLIVFWREKFLFKIWNEVSKCTFNEYFTNVRLLIMIGKKEEFEHLFFSL